VVVIELEKRDVECVVYCHRGREIQLISSGSYSRQDFEWSHFPVIELLAWSRGPDIPW